VTKAEFKEAMKRGLGRCIIELDKQNNIEKYREIVLWGCLRNLAYDTQCEGSRAEYMYILQSKFQDDYFETRILEKYKNSFKDSWLFDHYSEMLYWFAVDGSNRARRALYDKFEELLKYNSQKKQHKIYRSQREQFEWLCIWITNLDGFNAFKEIVARIGESYEKCSCQDAIYIDWFYENSKSEFGKKRVGSFLSKQSLKSSFVSAFKKETEKHDAVFSCPPEVNYTFDRVVEICKIKNNSRYRAACLKFAKNASADELESLANLAISEQDDTIRAQMLFIFRRAKFPCDISIIFEYSKSSNQALRNASFQVLENNPAEIVHQYAVDLIYEKVNLAGAISLLCKNFQKADTDLLIKALKSIPVTYEGDWHGAYSDVLRLCESNRIGCKELLLFMYENTLCSFCREYIVRALKKHKLLTEDIRNECLYDSNAHIRSFIKRLH
jgi:hypothetical protein